MADLLDFIGGTGRLRDNLRFKANTQVEQTIAGWINERIHIAKTGLDERTFGGSGALANSVTPDVVINTTGVYAKILAEDYWDFVNSGVNGVGKSDLAIPNAFGSTYNFKTLGVSDDMRDSLKGWIQTTGLSYFLGSSITISENVDIEDSIAYMLGTAIKRDGLESKPFMNEAFSEESIKDLANTLGKEVIKIMQLPF